MADLNRLPGTKRLIDRTFGRLQRLAAWSAWWPLLAVVGVYLFAILLGALEQASPSLTALFTVTAVIASVIAFLRGVRRYTGPTRRDAVSALDRQSDLRPLASLADRPARPDVEGVALWTAHEERLTDAVRRMNVPDFAALWRARDPFQLRIIAPVVFAVLLGLTWNAAPSRFSNAMDPDFGSLFGADSIRIEAWVAPPEHTGRAPIFLKTDQTEVRVPEGSMMTLRVQAPSAPKLRVRDDDGTETTHFEATPDGAYEIVAEITSDSDVSVRWWGERKAWSVFASPDAPPNRRIRGYARAWRW